MWFTDRAQERGKRKDQRSAVRRLTSKSHSVVTLYSTNRRCQNPDDPSLVWEISSTLVTTVGVPATLSHVDKPLSQARLSR